VRGPVALVLLAALAAGCLAEGPGEAGPCPDDVVVATPALDGDYMQTDPTQPWQALVYAGLPEGSALETMAWSASKGWAASSRAATPGDEADPADAHRLEVVTVVPGPGKGNATWSFQVEGPSACEPEHGTVTWDLAAPRVGMSAVPGQGVHVMTAGFLENGTLFYTNIPEIDTDARWPRMPWYLWEGEMPLAVYVYDQDRHEQPAYWQGASSAASNIPPTGSPADPIPHEYAEKADHQAGLGYFTTIRGFNEALKGLSTRTTHVVHLSPDEAYTLPGYEDHVLYGEAVVFYIKVIDVVDAPCPAETPTMFCHADVLPARTLEA
jgi:hypothetical protein